MPLQRASQERANDGHCLATWLTSRGRRLFSLKPRESRGLGYPNVGAWRQSFETELGGRAADCKAGRRGARWHHACFNRSYARRSAGTDRTWAAQARYRHYCGHHGDRAALRTFGLIAGTIPSIAAAEQARRDCRRYATETVTAMARRHITIATGSAIFISPAVRRAAWRGRKLARLTSVNLIGTRIRYCPRHD